MLREVVEAEDNQKLFVKNTDSGNVGNLSMLSDAVEDAVVIPPVS